MYQALYRKWRPKTFDDVAGQEHITETLKRQVREDRVSHAYIFVGTRGTGKTTCAKILARAVNCENPVNGNPCNCCKSCLGIEDGSVMDVEELDAASNNGVDNIRALRDEAIFSPSEVRKRVYIVDEVHMLSQSAFNALLKILEEPPEHLIFILATTEARKIPATILSRCQRFQFKRLSDGALSARMKYVADQEGMELTDDAAALLARLAEGSMRDGLSLLDQCAWEGTIDTNRVNATIGLAGNEATSALVDAVDASDAGSAITILDRLWRDGKDVSSVLGELSGLMRDALIVRVTREQSNPLISGMYPHDLVISCAKRFSMAKLVDCINSLQSAIAELARSTARKTVAELCLIRMCCDDLNADPSSLVPRIENIEKMLKSGVVNAQSSVVPGADKAEYKEPEAAPRPLADPTVPVSVSAEKNKDGGSPPDGGQTEKTETEATEKSEKTESNKSPALNSVQAGEASGWELVFETAKPNLERLARIYLSNSGNFRAELIGSRLELGIYSQSIMDYLDRDVIRDALAKAVTEVTGKPAVVTMALTQPQTTKRSMDDLAKMLAMKGF